MRIFLLSIFGVASLFLCGCNRNEHGMPADEISFLKDYATAKAAYESSKSPEKLTALNDFVANPHKVTDWVAQIAAAPRSEQHDVNGEKTDSAWVAVQFGGDSHGELFRLKISPDDAEIAGKILSLQKDQWVKFTGHSALKEIAAQESSEGTEIAPAFTVDQLVVSQ